MIKLILFGILKGIGILLLVLLAAAVILLARGLVRWKRRRRYSGHRRFRGRRL